MPGENQKRWEPSSAAGPPDLSIVIPAYNEAERLPATLAAVFAHLRQAPYSAEVVVVDDGSTDGTEGFVRGAQRKYPGLRLLVNRRNRGKGYSVKRGVLQSRGRVVLFADADLSTPIQEADRFLALLQQGFDVVLGSRETNRDLVRRPQPWIRRQAGRAFHRLVRMIIGVPFKDTQCGFKAFRRGAAMRLFPLQRARGFGFDAELMWLAQRLGLRCKEVGVVWVNDTRSSVSLLRDGPQMLLELIRVRWNGWRGVYDTGPRRVRRELGWRFLRGLLFLRDEN